MAGEGSRSALCIFCRARAVTAFIQHCTFEESAFKMLLHDTGMITIAERLYSTADGRRLVREGDGDAAAFFAGPGVKMPRDKAARYGIGTDGKLIEIPEEGQNDDGADDGIAGTAAGAEEAQRARGDNVPPAGSGGKSRAAADGRRGARQGAQRSAGK